MGYKKWGGWITLVLAFFGSLLVLLTFLVKVGLFGPIPSDEELANIQNNIATEILDESNIVIGRFYVENRINARDEEISERIAQTLIATEDARFFNHRGIDLRAWARVFFKTILLSNSSSGGGSTLSQQLAKNLYPRKSYALLSLPINKIREMLIALRLEKIYSKEDLLRLYLNTVPFSDNIYGIKTASARFFNKPPQELKFEEVAVLIGMLKANTRYNPVRNPNLALERRNTVINQLYKNGYISENESKVLKEKPLTLNYQKEKMSKTFAGYLKTHLEQECHSLLHQVKKNTGTSYNLYTDGLKIYTTISNSMQRAAEKAVQQEISQLQSNFVREWGPQNGPWSKQEVIKKEIISSKKYQLLKKQGLSEREIATIFKTPVSMEVFDWSQGSKSLKMSPLDSIRYYLSLLNVGFLAINPKSGDILAWVGGIDHRFFQYDHVKSKRQVGSTFKPILFAQALESGLLPCDYIANQPINFPKYNNWQPKNADLTYGGLYSMQGALAQSVNVVAARIIERIGAKKVSQLAINLGIEDTPEYPSIALGAVDASLLEMVSAYTVFVNDGQQPNPNLIKRIEDYRGNIIYQAPQPTFRQIIEPEHARIINTFLSSAIEEGTGKRLRWTYQIKGPLGGKTGTTQNQSDGWFIGLTPDLIAGVWVGASSPEIHFKSLGTGQGANSALPVFGNFLSTYLNGKSISGNFEKPSQTSQALLNCPPVLEEINIADHIQEAFAHNPDFYRSVLESMNLKESDLENLSLAQPQESKEEYINRLQEIQKGKEKRTERKNFWSKLLFKNNQKSDENEK